MSPGRERAWVPALTVIAAALVLAAACSSAGVHGGSGGAGGGGTGPDAAMADSGDSSGSGGTVVPSDGGADQSSCAFRAFTAPRVPLDLVLLVDASGSMNDPITGGLQSKWQLTREALTRFIRDPGSAGLGLGLQFFPLLGEGSPCSTPADCDPTAVSPPAYRCQAQSRCISEGAGADGAPWCSEPDGVSCLGGSCLPLGLCALTGASCTSVGTACAGGVPGDTCQPQPKTCQLAPVVCDAARYQQLAAPVADLPGAAMPLVRLLNLRRPGAVTPMAEAAIGTLSNLRERLTAMPGRHAALIIATDGLPGGCSNQDIPTIGDTLSVASTSAPRVPTYVIGVLDATDRAFGESALTQLAVAGGTRAPFILDPAQDLTQKLVAALDLIRNDALPCEYEIPADPTNTIDYGQVNLHVKGTTVEEDIPYAGGAAQCDATRGGWYYDVDPRTATPKRVIACPASCDRLKADLGGKVDLRFGCKTIVIQ